MTENLRRLGLVKITQVQPAGLIIETPSGSIYDPSRRVEVPQLLLTHQGIEAENPQGERILDIHHAAHSDTHNESDNAISIGFTSHYAQMRARFGEHMQDGMAGENIIISIPGGRQTRVLNEIKRKPGTCPGQTGVLGVCSCHQWLPIVES